jgi:hypothetical protein
MNWPVFFALVFGLSTSVATWFWGFVVGKKAGWNDGFNAAQDNYRIRREEQQAKLRRLLEDVAKSADLDPKDPKVKTWLDRSSSL